MWVVPSWVCLVCVLSALVTAMACLSAVVASATACTIASLVFVCSLAIKCIHTLSVSVYMRLLLLISCNVPCLSEDNTSWCLYAYLLLFYESQSESVFTCVHDYIYSDSALYWAMYMIPIGFANYMIVAVLVMCVWYMGTLITQNPSHIHNKAATPIPASSPAHSMYTKWNIITLIYAH